MNLPTPAVLLRCATCALVLAAGFAQDAAAQYKLVGPDGKITYTDRPPDAKAGTALPSGAPTPATAAPTPLAGLPLALRGPASRYPVTLYAQAQCEGCEASRQLLRQRGIPFSEKIVKDGDGEALQRTTGGRVVPTLTIGRQVLRGFSGDTWTSYLDAAGYPRESMLPANYVPAPPTPLVPPAPERPASATPDQPSPPLAPPPPGPGGIRF